MFNKVSALLEGKEPTGARSEESQAGGPVGTISLSKVKWQELAMVYQSLFKTRPAQWQAAQLD